MRINNQTVAHVRGSVTRARGGVDLGDWVQGVFDRTVSAELVACTLGQRERPELRLATGGVIRGPVLAARGKDQPELVIPLGRRPVR